MIGMIRAGGFSVDLTHGMHALGSRMLGFTRVLFDDSPSFDPDVQAVMLRQMAGRYHPNIEETAMAAVVTAARIAGYPEFRLAR